MGDIFQHFVLTRFNLKASGWERDKHGLATLTEHWLEQRFELFETFCLPSLQAQTNKSFIWYVFFDPETPKKYLDKIIGYEKVFELFRPVFVSSIDEMIPAILDIISQSDSEYIITSRVDNDDVLGSNFVDIVQSCFDFQDFLAVDQVDGYNLLLDSSPSIGRRRQMFNPFISLIEKNSHPKTVLCRPHGQWKHEKRYVALKRTYSWITVVHGKNVANTFQAYGKVTVNEIEENFIENERLAEAVVNNERRSFGAKFVGGVNQVKSLLGALFKEVKRKISVSFK